MSAEEHCAVRFEVLLFLALALAVGFCLLPFNSFLNPDGVEYVRLGQNIFSGTGLTVNSAQAYVSHPPLYSVLIGLAAQITHDGRAAGHFLSTLFYALAIIPFFCTAAQAYGLRTARWFGVLYATHGFLLAYANLIIAEPLLILLIGTMLCLVQNKVLQAQKDRSWRRLLSPLFLGLLGGLAYLTHPLGALFYVSALGALFFLLQGGIRQRCFALLVSLTVFLCLALPYALFVREVTDQLQLSGVAVRGVLRRWLDLSGTLPYGELKKIYEGLSTNKTEFKLDEMARQFSLGEYFFKDRFAMLRNAMPTLFVRIAGLSSYLYAGLGFILIGIALFTQTWDSRRKRIEGVRIAFLLPFCGFAFCVFEQRYYLPFIPVLLLWLAQGTESLRVWFKNTFNVSVLKSYSLIGLLCLIMMLPSAFYVARSIRLSRHPVEHRQAGLWMKDNIPQIQAESVAAQVPYAAFYSGAGILRLPYVEVFDDLLQYLRHHKARYFVIGDDLDTPTLHSYRFLLTRADDPAIPSEIRQVHAVHGEKNVYLYEVQGI